MTGMCPHCGEIVPVRALTAWHLERDTQKNCPGSQQIPRCAESDRRRLWNGKPNPHYFDGEDAAIAETVRRRDAEDDGTRYTLDEVAEALDIDGYSSGPDVDNPTDNGGSVSSSDDGSTDGSVVAPLLSDNERLGSTRLDGGRDE